MLSRAIDDGAGQVAHCYCGFPVITPKRIRRRCSRAPRFGADTEFPTKRNATIFLEKFPLQRRLNLRRSRERSRVCPGSRFMTPKLKMKSFKYGLMTLALGLMSLSPQAFADDKGTIGISMPTKSSARWIADGDNIVKTLQAKGYKTDLQYAEDDIPNQLAQSRI